MLKSCIEPGCPNLTQETRCAPCKRQNRRRLRADPDLTGNGARGDLSKVTRRRVLRRDRHRCRDCGAGEELMLHHVNGDARDDRPDNLVTLCRGCHRRRHAKPTQVHP